MVITINIDVSVNVTHDFHIRTDVNDDDDRLWLTNSFMNTICTTYTPKNILKSVVEKEYIKIVYRLVFLNFTSCSVTNLL